MQRYVSGGIHNIVLVHVHYYEPKRIKDVDVVLTGQACVRLLVVKRRLMMDDRVGTRWDRR